MGIKLMVEILDHWQDAGLTVGERSDLLVLAENANDGTRLTFGPVHADYILRRAGKTANGWKNAIGKLMAKKVLTVHTPGRIKQAAVYRLEPLCPESRHDGHKGMCTRPPKEERVTPQVTHPSEEGHLSDDPMGNPSGDPLARESHLAGVERVTSQVTPTPLYPSFKISSTTPSSPLAEPVETEQAVALNVTEGGGGGGSDLRSIAEHITASLDYLGQVPDKQQRKRLTAALVAVLQAGWTMDGLALYLHLGNYRPDNPAAFYLAKLTTKLPDMVPAETPDPPSPAAAGVRGPLPTAAEIEAATVESVFFGERPAAGPSVTWQEASQRAQALLAGIGSRGGTDGRMDGWDEVARKLGPHQPYSDDAWSAPAIAAEVAQVPWCGDVECEPVGRLREHIDSNGFKTDHPCEKCHPRMQWG